MTWHEYEKRLYIVHQTTTSLHNNYRQANLKMLNILQTIEKENLH